MERNAPCFHAKPGGWDRLGFVVATPWSGGTSGSGGGAGRSGRVCLSARSRWRTAAPTPSPTPTPTPPPTPPPTAPPTAVPTPPPSVPPTAGERNPKMIQIDPRKRRPFMATRRCVRVCTSEGSRGGSRGGSLALHRCWHALQEGAAMSLGRQVYRYIYKGAAMSLGQVCNGCIGLAIFAQRKRACTPAFSASTLQQCCDGVLAKLQQVVIVATLP